MMETCHPTLWKHLLLCFPVSHMGFDVFPEEFWKAEMSLFEETPLGQTEKQANALTRNLISSGLFQSKTKSPFIEQWTDIVQHNKLVKVKFKLCLLSWSNIKALLHWTIFPLPKRVCLSSTLWLRLAWDDEQDMAVVIGCGEEVTATCLTSLTVWNILWACQNKGECLIIEV